MTTPSPEIEGGAGASAEAIEHHYDVGNRFYATFLDDHMVYSSAMWAPGDDLARAQVRKLDHHLDASGAADGGGHLLDIGCGWGALLRHGVQNRGIRRATGLTLSKAQHRYCRQRPVPGVDVRLESWRDHEPESLYDAIVSVGAFEHFAEPHLSREDRELRYREFFERCWAISRPGARLSLQTISYDNMNGSMMSPFIADEIFPESDLPKISDIAEASDGLFSITSLRNDARDYEETCRQWLRRLRAHREVATSISGEAKVQQYIRYLTMVTMGFHIKNMGLLRIRFDRLDKGYRTR